MRQSDAMQAALDTASAWARLQACGPRVVQRLCHIDWPAVAMVLFIVILVGGSLIWDYAFNPAPPLTLLN